MSLVISSSKGVRPLVAFKVFCLLVLAASPRTQAYYPPQAPSSADKMPTKKTVMVTGANGYLASYIVRDLLASGHTVRACVRDASKESTIQHLSTLPGASDRLELFSTGNLLEVGRTNAFDAPMKGCDAVFHAATPVNVKFGEHSGERDIFQPAMASTQELLDCLQRNAATVRCLVLTSSMAAVAPRPEPAVKDESHWSDAEEQKERDNWYGCTKTSQERTVRDCIAKAKSDGILHKDLCYASICPTMVIGPVLRKPPPADSSTSVEGTMGSLQRWLQGGRSTCPNDSMSFVHVEDCARMHTKILELNPSDINEHQRYMSLIESLHWNDIMAILKELHPKLPDYAIYEGGDKVVPTQFNLDNRNSLQVPCRSTRETLKDSIKYLNQIGALD